MDFGDAAVDWFPACKVVDRARLVDLPVEPPFFLPHSIDVLLGAEEVGVLAVKFELLAHPTPSVSAPDSSLRRLSELRLLSPPRIRLDGVLCVGLVL